MPRKTVSRRSSDRPDGAGASMRPRPDAAENRSKPSVRHGNAVRFNEAAARCRGKPGPTRRLTSVVCRASMRPRPDAAENRPGSPPARPRPRRFNEAAARCRGKPAARAAQPLAARAASMRPRPDAAENPTPSPPSHPSSGFRFNEAAARCRGKPAPKPIAPPPKPGFNEAAARCRGKPAAPAGRPTRSSRGFNEAAARCRGKPCGLPLPWPTSHGFNEAAARCRGKPIHACCVKRHPKLTPWRHRKLTPEETAYVYRSTTMNSCGACGRRLRRPNRGGKRASRCGTPLEAPARVFHAGGRIHTTPGVDGTLARVAWREGPRPCPPRCRPCGHRVRARARRGVGRVVTGSAPVPAAVSAAWSCRCPRAGPPPRQAPIPGSSGRPLDASPAAGSSRR